MNISDVRNFFWNHHRGVVSTRRPDGSMHSSIVVCGWYYERAVFVSVYPKSVKIRNLRRDPRCTIMAVTEDWRQFVTVEGEVTLFGYDDTYASEMREVLRDVYMACSERRAEHPNWDEYQQAMIDQEAVVVMVRPERFYGVLRDSE